VLTSLFFLEPHNEGGKIRPDERQHTTPEIRLKEPDPLNAIQYVATVTFCTVRWSRRWCVSKLIFRDLLGQPIEAFHFPTGEQCP
jgi:hypothetical protein